MARQIINRAARRTLLSAALCMGLAGVVNAQSTSGTVYGSVAAGSGDAVEIRGSTGLVRTVPVDASGRYRAVQLPLDTYTITLKKNGEVVEQRENITPTVGAGTEISFQGASAGVAGDATQLDAVKVVASSVPPIDTSSVDSRTVITAKELAALPLAQSAEAIALLTPGAVAGSSNFSNGSYGTVSLGGASITENAYYINGYNVTDPLSGIGGLGLPYNVIAQQETYSGGYSAMYGRSNGGVLSQVGKRGTNDWHFGGQAMWRPRTLASAPKNIRYPHVDLPEGYAYEDDSLPGTRYRDRKDNTAWQTVYSAYVGGPIVPDRLFFFLAAESETTKGLSTSAITAPNILNSHYKYSTPKLYGKLDWHINDNNILEYTGIKHDDNEHGSLYDYDYETGRQGAYAGELQTHKLQSEVHIGKFTSYLTDDLTLTALYGESKVRDFYSQGDSPLPLLTGVNNQDPAITGGVPIRNEQTFTTVYDPGKLSKTHGYRIDLAYQLGAHSLSAGVDNMYYRGYNQGEYLSGPGYRWTYARGNPNAAINAALGVGAPGGEGYYVYQRVYDTRASMGVDQESYYIEDAWQVTDNLLLKFGIRNDEFVNFNNLRQAYVNEKNQWAPRLGFSWDIKGDATLKLFGNAGRYYLALPNSVAIRGASASTFTSEYFTYTGIDEFGIPTGLSPLGPGPVSANGEYGQAPDPATITSTNLKAQYQDEYILGLDMQLNSNWYAGIKGTYRELKTAIDDVCDVDRLAEKLDAQGLDSAEYDIRGCYIFNPGRTNTFKINRLDGSGFQTVSMSNADWGFGSGAQRKYYAVDLYLERPFDGTWGVRVDYTFSRSWGNTEGQVLSDTGQDDVSKTQSWDGWALMDHSNGLLANHRRHQVRVRGMYRFAPEWTVSGVLAANSGAPKSCLGYFGPNELSDEERDPIGYGGNYHWCGGQASAPGAEGDNPWMIRFDLGLDYRPAFAKDRLGFGLDIINLFDRREKTQSYVFYENDIGIVNNRYGQGTFFQSPRYVRLSVSYDF